MHCHVYLTPYIHCSLCTTVQTVVLVYDLYLHPSISLLSVVSCACAVSPTVADTA